MEKKRLNDFLEKEGELNSGITVSSSLIKNLEVYGFINCKCRTDIKSGYGLKDINSYGDVEIGIEPSKCHFFSFFMKQENKVTPIYPTISICQENTAVDVKELYIPSFIGVSRSINGGIVYDDSLYSNIKRRFGVGYEVTEKEWLKAGWPSRYTLKDSVVLSQIQKGEIVLKDADGCIKSVGESIVVLCRYIHEETGELRFFFSRLEHLYHEIKGTNKISK